MLVRLGEHGTITLPDELRAGLSEDTLFRVCRRDDGVIELQAQASSASSQAWFWTERWQQMEREADEDSAAGRVTTYDTAEDFLQGLDDDAKR
jgi:hypothetical protein